MRLWVLLLIWVVLDLSQLGFFVYLWPVVVGRGWLGWMTLALAWLLVRLAEAGS